MRETSRSSRRGPRLVPRDSIWSDHLSLRARMASQPRRRQQGSAQNAGSIHDWVARRVETARSSLKHVRRFRLATRGGQNGARSGFRAIQHGECALGALEGRFCLPGRCVRIGGRAPTQGVRPSAREALGVRNGQLSLRSRCLPPPSQNPMCRDRSVREPRVLGESGRAYRAAGAPPICTKPLRRRFRSFSCRHRISCWRIRWSGGPRRPGGHGEVGGILISILC